ncbi:ABC transporter permease [Kocuria rosea]|uniref:ABC transporter permease n=1 Tax=Kocuria rosea TaxID=1275 RepID=UPI000A8180FE|nr:ABC transporter permease [Kocuria polaris]
MPAELVAALHAEALKLRRSRVPWATAGAVLLAGAVGAFFMFVLQDVDRARTLGLLGTKAQLTGGTADWAGYFSLTGQTVSVGGLVIFGTAAIWLFGREFSDRTATDLLALPTSRTAVVLAKLLLLLGWCGVLTVLLVLLVLVLGAGLGLPGWSAGAALRGAGGVLGAGLLTAGLAVPYGLAASVGRGYLPAVAVLFFTVLTAQVLAAVGHGAWFPWAVPALLAGTAGPAAADTGWAGPLGVGLVALGSAAATAAWWERADHSA